MSTPGVLDASRPADRHDRAQLYIGGESVDPATQTTLEVIDSTTEAVMGTVPGAGAQDVDRAVQAARQAFPGWSATPVAERAEILGRIADGLEARRDEIAALIAREVGMPLKLATRVQATLPITDVRTTAGLLADYPWSEEVGSSLVVRDAVGVVGAITPWNYPLHQITAKLAAALGAGCTMVLKPSEIAPLNAFVLAEIVDASGLPAGVFNLVTGVGPEAGEALVAHPDVDMISFTGSTRAGKRIGEVAAGQVKRLALELGGKSANVILDDAPLERAVKSGVADCYLNSGQTCSALTRMLVPREQLAEVEQIATAVAESFAPGDPFDASTRLGPLVSAAQVERVRGFIEKGVEEGAKLLTGGVEPPEGLEAGFFVRPTVFSGVDPASTIGQEEIFGPVLAIIPYDSEDEAVEIANGTPYGLAGGVWSGDDERARRVALRLRTGQVSVNGGGFNPLAPFGGFKQSGRGREYGTFGIDEFVEVKSLQL